ncbi:MAG: YbjN domain-containing protein [Propionicimonas sp.]
MGFFDKSPATAGSGLAPISKERIKQALESQGWSYRVDSDGDIPGGWEHGFYWFFLNGNQNEILLVRGTWYPKLTAAELPLASQVCQEWNRDKLWPKVYPRLSDEGELRLHAEHIVDYEYGITDEQLVLHLTTAVNTGVQFFEHLNSVFPEAAAAEE